MDNQNPEYLDSLAGLFFVAGDWDKALKHQEQAARLAPEHQAIQRRLAVYRHWRRRPPRGHDGGKPDGV